MVDDVLGGVDVLGVVAAEVGTDVDAGVVSTGGAVTAEDVTAGAVTAGTAGAASPPPPASNGVLTPARSPHATTVSDTAAITPIACRRFEVGRWDRRVTNMGGTPRERGGTNLLVPGS